MRPKAVEVQCNSLADFNYEFSSIQNDLGLVETEETWDKISNAVFRLKSLTNNGAAQFPAQLIQSLRSMSRPLINCLNSERSKLSGVSLELFSALGATLESSFSPLLPIFLPALLTLCTRSNKVFCARAKACILDIIESTRLPAILPFLVESLKDKSVPLRLSAAEAVLTCLNTFDPPELAKEGRARDIESVIRITIKDANAEIRQISRKIFEGYNILVPDRVDAFVGPLTPTAKKYLNVKPMTGSSKDRALQSSTSSLQRSLAAARPPQSNPPSRPTSKAEHRPPSSLGNHLSNGSVQALPAAPSRQPVTVAPRTGPVRLTVAQGPPQTGPVRLSKRTDASRGDGPVRLLATSTERRPATEGPRRVTIVPMQPPPPPPIRKAPDVPKPSPTEQTVLKLSSSKPSTSRPAAAKPAAPPKPATSSNAKPASAPVSKRVEPTAQKAETTTNSKPPTAAASKAAASTKPPAPASKPSAPAKPLQQMKVAPKSTNNGWNAKAVPERANTKTTSTLRTTTKAAPPNPTKPSTKSATSKTAKSAPKDETKPPPKDAALVPLPPSPTLQPTQPVDPVMVEDTQDPVDEPVETTKSDIENAVVVPLPPSPAIVPVEPELVPLPEEEPETQPKTDSPILGDPYPIPPPIPQKQTRQKQVEQTPISALLNSIERGFRFPDFPPLPALAIPEEDEDESFEVCAPVVKGLNIRPREGAGVLIEMALNR